MRFSVQLMTLTLLSATFACGAEPVVQTFTSDIVQRRSCEQVGERSEVCVPNEFTQQVRVTLVEGEEERVTLSGVPLLGISDRTIYGTRDNLGGYLFESVQRSVNSTSGCEVIRTTTLSLVIGNLDEDNAICTPLEGRETQVTEVSAECDDVRVEPLAEVRTLRRRWERSIACGLAEEAL